MRIVTPLAHALALSLLAVQTVPVALATDIQAIIDTSISGTQVQEITTALSSTTLQIMQESDAAALQQAAMNGIANTVVDSVQTVQTNMEKIIDQSCTAASGSGLCFEEAAPLVLTDAVQNIDALAQNLLIIQQEGGSGSVQSATVSGAASAAVTADQIVSADVIIDIFQECSKQTGVCVQRAMPDVLTRAVQLIAANALNELDIMQETESGSVQQASADLVADVLVDAEQLVNTRAFIRLRQLCAIDIGLCIQRAVPIVESAVQQVIDAQSENTASIIQDGAEQQIAVADSASTTRIATQQTVNTMLTLDMMQQCGVRQGLCLRVDARGNPAYIFSDGMTTAFGLFTGAFDETPLQTEYSRRTVAQTIGGICGEAGTCSMVDRLLVWLFGPEPVSEAADTSTPEKEQHTSHNASRRGHMTNVLGASVRFFALRNDTVAPAAFGGSEVLDVSAYRTLLCSTRKQLLQEDREDAVWQWTAQQLSTETGLASDAIMTALHDASLCPEEKVVQAPALSLVQFPIAQDGPISSNALWNSCIRGAHITLEDIRANLDRNEDNLPRTCGSYHTGNSWYHPDLHVFFEWDRHTGQLNVPEGYVPMVQAEWR